MLEELKSLQVNQPGQRMWLSREAVLILRVGNGFDPPGWRLDKGYNSLKPRPEAGLRLCLGSEVDQAWRLEIEPSHLSLR